MRSKAGVSTSWRAVRAEEGYELARDDSLDAANKGLDFLSARGQGDYWIRNAEDEHIVWWMDGPRAVVRALSVPTFRIQVGQVTVTGGEPVVPPPPKWHESLRYFRLSQTTDDLFEAYRNLHLALESILDTLTPRLNAKGMPAEREGEWFKRALVEAGKIVTLQSFAPRGVIDPAQALWDELYRDRRSALFHAKLSRVYLLPHSSQTRHDMAESLKRLTGLYLALARHVSHIRRSSSGVFAAFWRLQTDQFADRLEIVATDDDPAPFSRKMTRSIPAVGRQYRLPRHLLLSLSATGRSSERSLAGFTERRCGRLSGSRMCARSLTAIRKRRTFPMGTFACLASIASRCSRDYGRRMPIRPRVSSLLDSVIASSPPCARPVSRGSPWVCGGRAPPTATGTEAASTMATCG